MGELGATLLSDQLSLFEGEYDNTLQPDRIMRLRRLYPQLVSDVAVREIAGLGMRAVEYLEQAPVLLALVMPTPVLISRWDNPKRHSARRYCARAFGTLIADGPRLKDVLAHYGMPLPARKICGRAVRPNRVAVINALKSISPSDLAQMIPAPDRQVIWLRALNAWHQRMTRRHIAGSEALLSWAGRAIAAFMKVDHPMAGDPSVAAMDIADYMCAHAGVFNRRWSWHRTWVATIAWHEELARQQTTRTPDFKARHGVAYDEAINYCGLPDTMAVDNYSFVALRTAGDLFTEGKVMKHCVFGYLTNVVQGECFIYSVRALDQTRIATLEIDLDGRICQLQGPANSTVLPAVRKAAGEFSQQCETFLRKQTKNLSQGDLATEVNLMRARAM